MDIALTPPLRYAGIRYSEYKKNKDKFLALWTMSYYYSWPNSPNSLLFIWL